MYFFELLKVPSHVLPVLVLESGHTGCSPRAAVCRRSGLALRLGTGGSDKQVRSHKPNEQRIRYRNI